MKEREGGRVKFGLASSSKFQGLHRGLVPLLQDLLQYAELDTFPHTSALWSFARV